MHLHVLLFIYVYSLNYWCFRPAYATPKVLERAGLKMSDISVFEFHEAFAVSEHNASLLLWNPFLFHSLKILIISIE